MQTRIESLRVHIEPLRQSILNHPVYNRIQSIADLQQFMQYHVYAVWDFMSLLKSLQQHLTCTQVPWFPVGDAETRFLINEIVVGEESDIDQNGQRKSHFELYLDAMQQCGADLTSIQKFTETLKNTNDLQAAFVAAQTPEAARRFVQNTFDVIHTGQPHLLSGVFTFGREDLIPGMFIHMVRELNQSVANRVSVFQYYLDRHIEIDGDHHSHLALRMTEQLCGNEQQRWKEVEQAVTISLQRRVELWDGVIGSIQNH